MKCYTHNGSLRKELQAGGKAAEKGLGPDLAGQENPMY